MKKLLEKLFFSKISMTLVNMAVMILFFHYHRFSQYFLVGLIFAITLFFLERKTVQATVAPLLKDNPQAKVAYFLGHALLVLTDLLVWPYSILTITADYFFPKKAPVNESNLS